MTDMRKGCVSAAACASRARTNPLLRKTDAITVAAGSRRGWAWVAVRDQGPGIAEAQRQRVFERFHRGPGGAGGSGLGLAIARQIAESHEGRLTLMPAGAGSTFVLWIPDRASVAPDRLPAPPDVDPLA